jgi:DNA end-binding protein Ku
MADRAIWKGSISFGLVEIPISLVSAEKPQQVKLSYLDRRDFSPVGYRRYNKATGEEVPWNEIVHGYEYEKGEYVALTEPDLRRANPELSRTVNIERFVDASEIEPIYYDKPYYLEPQKKSKGYVLLRETMKRTGKVGIARVVLRSREYLAAVLVRGEALMLQLLRFAHEVRDTRDLENVDYGLDDVGVSSREIDMAKRLVEDMLGKWKPEEYKDDYSDELMAVIENKIASGEAHTISAEEAPAPRQRGEIIDLMPLLQKSLSGGRATRERTSTRAKATAHRTTRVGAKRAASKKRSAGRRSA